MTAHRLYAAVYRRVSSALQTGGTSPETQLERGMRFIAEQGFEMVGDFYDGGISGARESRPELDRLFALCRAGRVDVVLVGDLSRLDLIWLGRGRSRQRKLYTRDWGSSVPGMEEPSDDPSS